MEEEDDNVSGYSKLSKLAVLKNGKARIGDHDEDEDSLDDFSDTDSSIDEGFNKTSNTAPPNRKPTFELPRVATSGLSNGMDRVDRMGSLPLTRRLSINSAPALTSEEVGDGVPLHRRHDAARKRRLLPPIHQQPRQSLMEDVNVPTMGSQARGRKDVDNAVEETFNRLARCLTPHSGPTSPRPPPTSTRYRAKRLSSSGSVNEDSTTQPTHLSSVTFVEISQTDEHGREAFAPQNELNFSFDADGGNQLFGVMHPEQRSLSASLNEDAAFMNGLDHPPPLPAGSPRGIMLKPTGILNASNPAVPAPVPPRQPKGEPFGRRISSRTPDSGRLTPRFLHGGKRCEEADEEDDDDHVSRIMQIVKRMSSNDMTEET